jgi:hypothetical protein
MRAMIPIHDWIESFVMSENNSGAENDTGQIRIGVKISLPISYNALTMTEA